ncbi:hypothetical protein AXE80_01280 [Wenyingzhuangia fucanilytica]|uniref:Carboxypeptidase-like regulatory domain-containing protein n=1 Tax=Wenyingzhuangia fucanilytica TaxID=1790137 RepID=A0A1B1Y2K6_9FLAO|nr:DUF5686 family protein [Wenyingzhuangia fucanilytica]ANW95006.1 hypothetical protein AXE80_01280 [Wenyingzhuangia fucanilytica]
MTLKKLLNISVLLTAFLAFSQSKVKGVVVDVDGNPLAFASVIFKNSTEGTVSDEDGVFYLSSPNTHKELQVSYVGFDKLTVGIEKQNQYFKIVLKESSNQLQTVTIVAGRIPKKGNPAIALLEKVWARKKSNGLKMFPNYEYEKYEKIQFDLNNIDSSFTEQKIFKGMEFVFDQIDTSRVSGKNFLPVYINESVYKVYGKNKENNEVVREDLVANKNSGIGAGEGVTTYIKDLYVDYNIYDDYIRLFGKSFTSPVGKSGVNTYNYVLADSANISGKWCYNIIYYPIRKNELTFKGDMWIADTVFAVKDINMQVSKSANLNWIKEVFLERDYKVENDSVILPEKDYMMADFSLRKKKSSMGVFGKRTTYFDSYSFNNPKKEDFYKKKSDVFADSIYNATETYWKTHRQETLDKNEQGIYTMLDTLKTVPKFKKIYNLGVILATGYVEFPNFDYGPVFSTFDYNDVEGVRIRVGGRTYFGINDMWRIQGYTAYGFKDRRVKYGLSYKYMFDKQKRLIFGIGHRDDVEQTGAGLTTSNDVLGRSFATSGLFSSGASNLLTDVQLTNVFFSAEPVDNINFELNFVQRNLKSASPAFSLSYIDDNGNIQNKTQQTELGFAIKYTPRRKVFGNGVERKNVNDNFPVFYLSYANGFGALFNSEFNYQKLQMYYKQPFYIGAIGRTTTTLEVGKTFGEASLALLNIVPGNQSFFNIQNTFGLLNYYEFVTDTYASLHFEHNFNGRVFGKIPFLRKLNLREIVGIKGAYGTISQSNINRNLPAFQSLPFLNLEAKTIAPSKIYYEYNVGIDNILKVFRLDFYWRGNYLHHPNANKFGVKGSFGFTF